ncbi:MAG: YegS/Rv2252/BmrU family lipid kinase [Bacilli bacterium]
MRAQIIYNPTSGKELFKTHIHKVVEKLSSKGYIVEVYPTKCVGDANSAAIIASNNNVDLLVVSGGDGTLHEIVNGLAEREYKPTILYIPSGTTNDFAKSIKIPTNFNNALGLIDNGIVKSIDIGKINNKFFVYVACFGAFTKVSYSTSSKLKSVFGHLAYVFSGVSDIPKLNEPLDVELIVDDKTSFHKSSIFLVANSTGFAGLKNILPNSRVDDGKFDVINLNSKNIGILPELIKNITTGVKTDINKNGIMHLETKQITIRSKKKLKWNLDGEYGIDGDATISCLSKHIKIIVPK